MALKLADLAASLASLFDSGRTGFGGLGDAAQELSSAYDAYARAAQDASTDKVATAYAPRMAQTLTAGLPGTRAPDAGAKVFADAFIAYWTGATFACLVPPAPGPPNVGGNAIFSQEASSAVVGVNAGPLAGALSFEFSRLSSSDTAATKGQAIAAIFHAATTSDVQVLISGLDTSPTPVPITNTGHIR